MEEKLLTLYAKVSREAARMQVYQLRAKKDGRQDLATLFRALEYSHTAQANRLLMQLRGFIANSQENLATVLESELPELSKLYATQETEAEAMDNKAVSTGCNHSVRITKMNMNLAKKAQDRRGHETYYICDFCGFISADKRPDNCPICTATSRRFIKVPE